MNDPERYGVVSLDKNNKAISIVEKPENPESHYAVPGLYFYDHRICDFAKSIKPSARGELEITDINRAYLKEGLLDVELLGRGMAWLDTGTCDSLMEASNFVAAIQKRQGQMIACLEEIAYRMGMIDDVGLSSQVKALAKTEYGAYLNKLLLEREPLRIIEEKG